MNRFDGRLSARDGDSVGRALGLLNPLTNILVRGGILKEDLDYNVLRGAMVIIFFFFGYQKWWAYEAERLIPPYQPWSADFLVVSGFWPPRGKLVSGQLRMDVRHAAVARFLEQEIGHARRPRLLHDFHRHSDDHPLHAGRLGRLGRRVPRHDRQRSVPDEGRRVVGRILLSSETGRAEGREVISNQPTTISGRARATMSRIATRQAITLLGK
jgi:hypothetical protein